MNVVGSRPDGWWEDPPAAMERLVRLLAAFAAEEAADVTVVFDGPQRQLEEEPRTDALRVVFAAERGAAEADDVIVDLATESADSVRVVTSDRGLVGRLPARTEVIGAGGFRDRLEALAG